MQLQEIICKNKEYRLLKEECDTKREELKYINDLINVDDLKVMPFDEIKDFYDMVRYKVNDKNIENQIKDLYKSKKIEKYPILNKAHYYSIINEIDFLTDEQKKNLDHVLTRFHDGYVMTGSSLWYGLDFNEDQTNKILEFLYDKKIISKIYHVKCKCGSFECPGENITELEYENFIKYHSITPEQVDKMTDKERDEYENNWRHGYLEVGCWNDGLYEICDIDDWNNAPKEIKYVNYTEPDRSLDDILDV